MDDLIIMDNGCVLRFLVVSSEFRVVGGLDRGSRKCTHVHTHTHHDHGEEIPIRRRRTWYTSSFSSFYLEIYTIIKLTQTKQSRFVFYR